MTEASPTSPPIARAVTPPAPMVKSLPLLLLVVCAVQFLDAMDIASMGPALPLVQADLGMTTSALQWVVSAYALGFGGFLLLGGRLADLYNRKKLLIGWLAVFVVASVLGGIADNGVVLVVARLLKGVSAGITAPAAMAILLDAFRDEQSRNRALGTFLAVASAGYSLGLILGGLMAGVSWRLVLFAPAVAGLLVALLAASVVPSQQEKGKSGSLDILGAVTVTAGAVALVYGLSRAASDGWGDAQTIGSLIAAAVLFPLFALVESRHPAPLVPLAVFRKGQLTRALVAMLFFGAYVSFQFVLTLYYQEQLHWSPLEAGLAFLLGGVLTAGTARYGAALVTKYGAWPVATGGLVLLSIGYLGWVLLMGQVDPLVTLFAQQLLGGLGFAAVYPALNIAAVGTAAPDEQGLVSGLFNAGAQIGNGVVIALTATVFSLSTGGIAPYRAGLWTVTAITLAVTVVALAGAARHRQKAAA
ncbi:MFS transporter [Streptomyces sp. 3211.6]|uniref:MFS transporter n=1 Tax=Streptomyces TaxID=1883 RepID=UPI0009A52F78|nr:MULTISPECIES: MFS transporter [Streptomyces]RKS97135.1 MFS transporter [Streptomyces sp. 3211.6]RPF25481.1 MFS transporter [Streptomyces sp. Ag109_G2-6]